SLALAAERADATPVVLKVQYPHRECAHEAEALRVWDGDGAVRLLAHDPTRHALLLERCTPGSPLSDRPPGEALEVLIGLLPRLWRRADASFHRLEEEAARWRRHLPERWAEAGRPFERALLDEALAALEELPASQPEQVLLHQDLHGGNVLRAQREPWLVIDPKPLVGERAFAVAPIVRSAELGHEEKAVRRRLAQLARALDLDPERARRWALAQTLAWGFDEHGARPRHVEVARWLRPPC
ncbi:MAG: aminoglycoside phosphotransferase family protein, partial [Myxococcota bacterium]|nr:aminoglycoside phosphotransferase family protein [Myxococcota bacterium]